MKLKIEKVLAFVLIGGMVMGNASMAEASANPPKHGSSKTVITKEMTSEEIPSDYSVCDETQGKNGAYNQFFLKDDLQTVSIEIDENNLNYMFQNALDKPTVLAKKVTIGEQSVSYVGLKTKGSYTLEHSFTDNPKSDRFSLTINFGKYIKKANYGEKQNFYGVEKISFNNFFFDRSMMKEYCALALMTQMGVPTPQYGLAKVYINGQYYGVYSMIEALDSPILEQYYDCDAKEISDYLCKPENTAFIYDELKDDMSPMWEEDEDTYKKVEKMLPTVEEWVRRLNCLNEGKDFSGNAIDVNSDEYLVLLEEIIDVDEYLRYFAAHSYLCQLDNMFVGKKNFGLYVDENGKSLIIPWDYDLSFGCYSPVTAEATANNDIDTMFIPEWGVANTDSRKARFYKDFPIFNVIYQNEKLLGEYHTYMLDCSKIMFLGGTTSDGRVFEPNQMVEQIKALTDSLLEAAEEPVAERAVYMNGMAPQRALQPGLTNLKKIVAMRSVGVFSQVNGIDTTVSGKGCDLSRVGNGQDNWWLQNTGNITAVNADYGIFTSAVYAGATPVLEVKEITKDDEKYSEIAKAVHGKSASYLKIYDIDDKASKKVNGTYQLFIPMNSEQVGSNLQFLHIVDGKANKLKAELSDNIYTIETDELGIIVIKEKGNFAPIAISLAGVLIVLILLVIMKKSSVLGGVP